MMGLRSATTSPFLPVVSSRGPRQRKTLKGECGDTRQRFSFEELEGGSPARALEVNLAGEPELCEGRCGVAAAGDRVAGAIGDGDRDGLRSLRESVPLEDA